MKNKILSIIIIMTILLISISSVALASSYTVSMSTDKSSYEPGDQVVITLSLTNIDKGDKDGINAIKGTINIPSNYLTYVSSAASSGWTMQAFNTDNNTFAITRINSDYITNNNEFMTITLKVNNVDASVTKAVVTATGLEASFGLSSDITSAKTVTGSETYAEVKINSSNSTADISSNNQDVTPSSAPKQTATPSTPSVTNPDTSTKAVPQTGISDVILPAVAILGVIAVVSYIRYRKFKNI